LSEAAQLAVQRLRNEPTMRRLSLAHEPLGDAGARALAAELERNTVLNDVALIWSDIGNDGVVAIVMALRANRAVKRLWLFSELGRFRCCSR